jgi:ubiquinone/menaquinone biosynthesis C-methylase UbiE
VRPGGSSAGYCARRDRQPREVFFAGGILEAVNPRIPGGPHQRVAALVGDEPGLVLDVCAGTGYLARLIARANPGATVHALDAPVPVRGSGARVKARYSPSRQGGEVRTSVDYDERQYAVYAKGRALSPTLEGLWASTLASHLGGGPGVTLLDLGSGAGRWAEFLAERLDCEVVGIEPSRRMREVAAREHAHRRVCYLQGSAQRIPLPDGSCDAAWLSDVAHHIADAGACAHELRRVLRPEGLVLVRGILPKSIARAAFVRFFPTAWPTAKAQAAATAAFLQRLDQGFESVAHETIEQEVAPSLSAYFERIALRAISTLELISDAEFEAGLARMRAAARAESVPQPVTEPADLVVLRRRT